MREGAATIERGFGRGFVYGARAVTFGGHAMPSFLREEETLISTVSQGIGTYLGYIFTPGGVGTLIRRGIRFNSRLSVNPLTTNLLSWAYERKQQARENLTQPVVNDNLEDRV